MRVEDGQEGDRQERAGDQADAPVVQPYAGRVDERHRRRPEQRRGDARDEEHARRVVAYASDTSAPLPIGQPPPNQTASTACSRYENAGGFMK